MRYLILALAFAILTACAEGAIPQAPADKVLLNADILTMDPANPRAQALAIRDGIFVAVGTNEKVRNHIGSTTEVIDMQGQTVVPGLTDSHYHLRGVGIRELTLNLAGARTLDEMLEQLKDYADAHPDRRWITGRGWIETHYDPPVFPTRHDLDRAVPDRPVILTRADGHASVANTRALQIARIGRGTNPPFGGEILRDERGDPTGMLIDRAQNLVRRHVPNDGQPDIKEALRIGGEVAHRQGWSGIHNIVDDWADIEALKELYEEDAMPIRNYVAIRWPSEGAERLLTEGPTIIDEYDGRLTVRAIKINLDGALGSRGAALLEPYADDPGNTGLLTHTPNELQPVLERALRKGIQVWTHAIGDRANRLILDLYEEAFAAVPEEERAVKDPRWRVEHAQHLTEEDIPRFAQLGVIASMQPSHAIGDLHFAPARLGMERLQYAYAWRSLLDAGAIIAGGSDAPVEVGDPCIELHAATTRTDLEGFSGEGWFPEEAVDRQAALQMFTTGADFAEFRDRRGSTIAPGAPGRYSTYPSNCVAASNNAND